MSQKVIYQFSLPFETEVEKIEISKDEAGTETKITKKVKETTQKQYAILKPTRIEREELEEFRVIQESNYIRMGILPYDILFKKLVDDGGIITEEEKKERAELLEKFIKLQSDYGELAVVKEEEKTEENKKQIDNAQEEIGKIMRRIQEIDNIGSGIFEKSAEGLARNKSILRLMLFTLHEVVGEKYVPVFKGKTFKDKMAEYDALEERAIDFEYELVKKSMLVAGYYYLGRASSKEDFDLILGLAENQHILG